MLKLYNYLYQFYRRGAEERAQVHLMLGFVGLPLLLLLPFCIYVFFRH